MPKKTTSTTARTKTAPDAQLTAIRKIIQALVGLGTSSQLSALKFVEERVSLARAEESKAEYGRTSHARDSLRYEQFPPAGSNVHGIGDGPGLVTDHVQFNRQGALQASPNGLIHGLAKDPVRG